MPKTLNPQNTFPTNIPNFPISGNNEPIAIEPLENAIQAVLNRSENLHVRLSEAETQGVKRVRTVASLAALSAATGFNNGDVCDVEGYGRYRLYNPSGLTADGLWVLNASGGGRWVHTLRDMRGAGNGLATLDSSQRLAQDVRDASILTQHIANQAVTSAKLAPGSVVGHLGYTPLNRAGDTMSGVLTIAANVGEVLSLKGGSSNHGYLGIYAQSSNQNARSAYIGFGSAGTSDLTIANERGGNVVIPSGLLQARYDHQNRFAVSMNAGVGYSFSISANNGQTLGTFLVDIPAGKNLYVRRARFNMAGVGALRLRVYGNIGNWTSSNVIGDETTDTLVGSGGAARQIGCSVQNTSGSTVDLVNNPVFCWVELEIR